MTTGDAESVGEAPCSRDSCLTLFVLHGTRLERSSVRLYIAEALVLEKFLLDANWQKYQEMLYSWE